MQQHTTAPALNGEELADLMINHILEVVSCDYDTLDIIACRLVHNGWTWTGGKR